MKSITTFHDKFSLRYTDDRDVYFYYLVSRYGNYFLNDDWLHSKRPDIEEIRSPINNERRLNEEK